MAIVILWIKEKVDMENVNIVKFEFNKIDFLFYYLKRNNLYKRQAR